MRKSPSMTRTPSGPSSTRGCVLTCVWVTVRTALKPAAAPISLATVRRFIATNHGPRLPVPISGATLTQRNSPKFTGVAVTVAVNRDANGEVGVKSYSEYGGECGIRTRGGGFAGRTGRSSELRTHPSSIHKCPLASAEVRLESAGSWGVAVTTAVIAGCQPARQGLAVRIRSHHLTLG